MKFGIRRTSAFKTSIKKIRNPDLLHEIASVIDRLANNETLEEKYHDHQLKGKFAAYRECHIKPDCCFSIKNTTIFWCLFVSTLAATASSFKNPSSSFNHFLFPQPQERIVGDFCPFNREIPKIAMNRLNHWKTCDIEFSLRRVCFC